VKGEQVNTLVWVKVGPNGAVDLTNATGSTHVLVDVEGYYTAATGSGDVLTASDGTKLFDSRTTKTPVPAGAVRTVQVVGRGGVPSGATAVVVQLTGVRPAQRDYVRTWTAGAARPTAYALYAPKGATTSATAIVPLSGSGAINISPAYATHVAVSVEGWFAPSSSATAGVTSLVTPPRRVLQVSLAANATRTVTLPRPAGTAAAIVTIGAAGPSGTFVSLWPSGGRAPSVATMSLRSGWVRTSRVTRFGTNGAVSIHNAGRSTIQIVVDVAGWA
jgi:hypothetical protein